MSLTAMVNRMNQSKKPEVINQLLGYDLKIVQRPDMFNFSLDSTLLADFATVSPKVETILDLGTGCAPIPLILSQKTQSPIIGLELQGAVYELAKKNVALNNLENQITIIKGDIHDSVNLFKASSFDLITCNPPFFKVDPESNLNAVAYKTIARHEVKITLETILAVTSQLLKAKGHFVMVHRATRLNEIMVLFKQWNLAIKRMRFVYPKADKEAVMVLIDAVKQGKEGMRVLAPLIVHAQDGYTEEILKIFNYERT